MNVVLEPLELQVQYGWEALKDDTLFRVLQAVPFSLIFVLAFKRLLRHVLFERLVQVFAALDIKLNV